MRLDGSLALVALSLVLLANVSPSAQTPVADEGQPRELGLIEKTGRDLVQIDVSLFGPPEILDRLTARDFEVTIGGHRIEEFALDRLCSGDSALHTELARTNGPNREPIGLPVSPSQPSYVFYFDHFHLTSDGRVRSIDLARELAPDLIAAGGRAMLVSAAARNKVLVDWTEDPEQLLEGLDRLAGDGTRHESVPDSEGQSVLLVESTLQDSLDLATGSNLSTLDAARATRSGFSRVIPKGPSFDPKTQKLEEAQKVAKEDAAKFMHQMNTMAVDSGKVAALTLQAQEQFHTAKALRRFSALLAQLSETHPPKAVLYFADTLRPNPGDHYVELYARKECGPSEILCQVTGGPSLPEFEQVINEAATYGVRLYTVQGRGLINENGTNITTGSNLSILSGPMAAAERFTDAKNGLVSLATETGGRAFLNGVGADKIVKQIEDDLRCVFLVSFEPVGLPRDRPLGVLVTVRQPNVSVSTRSRVVVQSPQAKKQSRLTQAFLSPDSMDQEAGLEQIVIPTGFSKRGYSALVQVALPVSSVAGAMWDVGVSLTTGSRKPQHASGRVGVREVGVPLVFETELEFAPGAYELTVVAHDTVQDVVVTGHGVGEWPEPGADKASLGPIALLQPARAIFVRGEENRRGGSLGRSAGQWVDPARPTALIGIVCRGRSGWAEGARIERRIVGEGEAAFKAMTPDGGERCLLFSDVIPAGVLSSGSFEYQVAVSSEGGPSDVTAEHRFIAVGEEYRLASGTSPEHP